jgi:predicted ArsR family transcriptional regulator
MWIEPTISTDDAVLDLLRERDSMSVAELSAELAVTGTAVRQRLNRLMANGLVARHADRSASGRGRPSHRYRLTREGRRKAGTNLPEFAVAAWEEIREIEDPEIRRKLLTRIAKRLVRRLAEHVRGGTLDEKVDALVTFFEQRRIPYRVERQGQLPVLTTSSCPYPELADEQRTICTLERNMFEELLGGEIRQHACLLDGGNCCSFELTATAGD